MPIDAALCNIKHSSDEPFCLEQEARTAALVGKEGGLSWLNGAKAAEHRMQVKVSHSFKF